MKRGGPLQRRTPLRAKTGITGHKHRDDRTFAQRFPDPGPPLDLTAAGAALSRQLVPAPEFTGPVPDVSKATPRPSSTGFPPVVRQTILDRDHYRCARCGRSVESGSVVYSLQHRDNRAMGGTRDPRINHPANGVVLCGSGTTGCHGWVEDHEDEAARCGWVVKSWADATTVPVLYADFPDGIGGPAWGLLTDVGTVWRTKPPETGDAHHAAQRKAPLR